jgi:glycosyltransferase involved in cell wall biosynthesis
VLDHVPGARFVLVGDELYLGMSDSVGCKQAILRTVEELALRDRCLFLGNRKDVERYYPICDVTALPSLFEGTPNVALESMACGVPVVASNVSDNSYVIPDGRSGYVVPVNDEVALADRIIQIVRDRPLCAQLGEQARAWVMQEFSCRRLAEKTAAVYHEALQMHSIGRTSFTSP